MMAQGQTEKQLRMGVNCNDQLFRDIVSPKHTKDVGRDPAAITAAVMDKIMPMSDAAFMGRGTDIALLELGAKAFVSEKIDSLKTELSLDNAPTPKLRTPALSVRGAKSPEQNSLPASSAALSASALLQKLNRDMIKNSGEALKSSSIVQDDATSTKMTTSSASTGTGNTCKEKEDMVTLTLEPIPVMISKKRGQLQFNRSFVGQMGASGGYLRKPHSATRNLAQKSFVACTSADAYGNAYLKKTSAPAVSPPSWSPAKELKITAQSSGPKSYSDGRNLWRFTPGYATKSAMASVVADKSLWSLAETIQRIGTKPSQKRKFCAVSDYYIRYLNQPKRARHEAFKIIFKTKTADLDTAALHQTEEVWGRFNRRNWPNNKPLLPGYKIVETGKSAVPKRSRKKSSALSSYRVTRPKRKYLYVNSHITQGPSPKTKKVIHTSQNLSSVISKFVPVSHLKWNPVLKKFVRPTGPTFTKKFSKSQCFTFPSASGNVNGSVLHKNQDKPRVSGMSGNLNTLKYRPGLAKCASFFAHSARQISAKTGQDVPKFPHSTFHKCKDVKAVLECHSVPQPNFTMTLTEYIRICVIFQVRKLLAAKALGVSSSQNDGLPRPKPSQDEPAKTSLQTKLLMTSTVLISPLTEQVLIKWSKLLPLASEIDVARNSMISREIGARKPTHNGNSNMPGLCGSWLYGSSGMVRATRKETFLKNNPSGMDEGLLQDAFNAWHYDEVDIAYQADQNDAAKASGPAEAIIELRHNIPAMSPQKMPPLRPKPIRFTIKAKKSHNLVASSCGSSRVLVNGPVMRTLRSRSQSRTLCKEERSIKKKRACHPKLSYCVRYRLRCVPEIIPFQIGPVWEACGNTGGACSPVIFQAEKAVKMGRAECCDNDSKGSTDVQGRCKKFDNIFESVYAMGMQNGHGPCDAKLESLYPSPSDPLSTSLGPQVNGTSSRWDVSVADSFMAGTVASTSVSRDLPHESRVERPIRPKRFFSLDSGMTHKGVKSEGWKSLFAMNGFHTKRVGEGCIVKGDMKFKRRIGDTEIFHVKGVRRFSTPEEGTCSSTDSSVKFAPLRVGRMSFDFDFNISPPNENGQLVRKIGPTEIFHKCAVKHRPPPLEEIDGERLEKMYGKSIEELARIAWLEDSFLGLHGSEGAEEPKGKPSLWAVSAPSEDKPLGGAACGQTSNIPHALHFHCLYSLSKRQLSCLLKPLNKREKATGATSIETKDRREDCEKEKKAVVADSKNVNTGDVSLKHCAKEGSPATAKLEEKKELDHGVSSAEDTKTPAIGARTVSNPQLMCIAQAEQALSNCVKTECKAGIGCSGGGGRAMGNLLYKRSAAPSLLEAEVQCKKEGICNGSGTLWLGAKIKQEPVLVDGSATGRKGDLSCLLTSEKAKEKYDKKFGIEGDVIESHVKAENVPNCCPQQGDVETIPFNGKDETETKDGTKDPAAIRSSHRLRPKREGNKRGRYEADYVTDLPKSKKAKKALPCRDYDEDKYWQFYRDCQKSEHVKNLILQHKYIKLLKSKQIECQVQPLFNGLYSQYSNVTCAKSFLKTADEALLPNNGILPFMSRFSKGGKKGPPEALKPTTDGVCPYCARTFQENAPEELTSHMERHKMRSTILSVPHLPRKKKKKGKNSLRPAKPPAAKTTVVFVEPESALRQKTLACDTAMAKIGLVAAQSLQFPPIKGLVSSAEQANLEQLKNIKAFPRPSHISMGHRKQTARKSHSNLAANLSKEKLIAALASKAKLFSPSSATKSPAKVTCMREKESLSRVGGTPNHTPKKKATQSNGNGKHSHASTRTIAKFVKTGAVNVNGTAEKQAQTQEKVPSVKPAENKKGVIQVKTTKKTTLPIRVTSVTKKKIGLFKYAKDCDATSTNGVKVSPAAEASQKPKAKCATIEMHAKSRVPNGKASHGELAVQTRALLRSARRSSPAISDTSKETEGRAAKRKRVEETVESSQQRSSKRSL